MLMNDDFGTELAPYIPTLKRIDQILAEQGMIEEQRRGGTLTADLNANEVLDPDFDGWF